MKGQFADKFSEKRHKKRCVWLFFHAWFASESYITAKANWVLTTGQSDYKIIYHAPNWAVCSQTIFQCQPDVNALEPHISFAHVLFYITSYL